MPTARVRRAGNRVQLLDRDVLITEIVSARGPTHGYFDVLGAAVSVLSPGQRVAVLGFGAGGFVPPLRALGGTHEIHAVDVSGRGYQLFHRTFGARENETRTHFRQNDAASWLRRRSCFDFILEDLSEMHSGEPVKPETSVRDLPPLIRQRLKPGGVLATTLLPRPGWPRTRLAHRLRSGLASSVVITFDDLETRLLIGGDRLPPAGEISRRLRRAMSTIGSERALGLSVRAA